MMDLPTNDVGACTRSNGTTPLPNFAHDYNFTRHTMFSHNPHMVLVDDVNNVLTSFVSHIARRMRKSMHRTCKVLDVGGNSGKPYEREIRAATGYTSLDFVARAPDNRFLQGRLSSVHSIVGDVQRCNTHLPRDAFDISMALSVFEHLLSPWTAAQEILRMTANGGHVVIVVPFTSRYHAYPIDTGRYTHTMLRYFFERRGGVRTVFSGYSVLAKPTRHGHFADGSDEPPDAMSGANHDIALIWIGRRLDGEIFNTSTLDRNRAFAADVPDPNAPQSAAARF